MRSRADLLIAITGFSRGENPQPGSAVARSLRREWPEVQLAALVYDGLESGIYAGERPNQVFLLPYLAVEPEVWLQRVDEIRSEFPFTMLIPTLDAEMEPLFRLRKMLEDRGVQVLLPKEEAFRRRGKSVLPKLAEADGFQVPATRVASSVIEAQEIGMEVGFPLYVKGRFYDAYRAYGPADLDQWGRKMLAEWGAPIILQEVVEGAEFNVVGVCDGGGDLLVSCAIRKMVLSTKGKGYGGITVRDSELEKVTASIISELAWEGPFELEFIKRKTTGEYVLLEMNPRFPAWVDYPSALGVNLPTLAVCRILGESITSHPPVKVGEFFLRHNEDVVCRVDDLGRLTTQGVLPIDLDGDDGSPNS